MSQAAAAREAFMAAQKKANATTEERLDESMTPRQRAMQNLARGGVATKVAGTGAKGDSQHAAAMKAFGVADQPKEKVIPNWKQTGAQKKAFEEKKAMRAGGESQMSAAMKAFGGQLGDSTHNPSSATSTPRTFVPTAHTPGGATWNKPSLDRPRASTLPSAGAKVSAAVALSSPRSSIASNTPQSSLNPSAPVVRSTAASVSGAAEAEEGVTKDLDALVAGIRRLGVTGEDGTVVATFGNVVDDEELEQKLESLVGTLKAGRRRGVLEWEGQLLLKGKDDQAPIKLLPAKDPAPEVEVEVEVEAAAAPAAVEVS